MAKCNHPLFVKPFLCVSKVCMNKKQIKRIFKQEKKQIKTEAKKAKQKAKQKYLASLQNCTAKPKKPVVDPPKRTVLEEVGNAVTHGAGSLFAILALVLMLVQANTTQKIIAACVYAFGMIVLFTMSCLYHSFRHGSAVKRIFRRFDYSSIYLLIGATFAPILLCYVGGTFGLVFFIIQWAIIAVGITFVGVFGPTKLKVMHIMLYLVIGWSGLVFIPQMLGNNVGLFAWILGGGVVYSIGIIPYALRKKCSHFIWHFFVLAGAIVQWVGIYNFIYLI